MNDSGKVDVGEARQNYLAFKMNATSKKVLRECLVGIIITEPERERGVESEDEEALEWRGFRAGMNLRLSAINTTNINKIEKGKKETIRKAPKQFKYNKYIEK